MCRAAQRVLRWRNLTGFAAVLSLALLSGCAQRLPPLAPVEHVDLERFMGEWYVLANIPTFIEKGAHNAVESYELDTDGSIATTFSFRAGSFDGERKVYRPRGFVLDRESNAVWGMRFVWPVKADYRIIHLETDYSATVIGRNRRDYVWIMARTPQLPEQHYRQLVAVVSVAGYDVAKLEKVPQRW